MKRFHSLLVVLLLLANVGTATAIMPAVFAALAVPDGHDRQRQRRKARDFQWRVQGMAKR
jgi:hypothetical protein